MNLVSIWSMSVRAYCHSYSIKFTGKRAHYQPIVTGRGKNKGGLPMTEKDGIFLVHVLPEDQQKIFERFKPVENGADIITEATALFLNTVDTSAEVDKSEVDWDEIKETALRSP